MRISDWISDVCSSDLSCLDRPIGIFAMRQPMASVDDDIQMIRDLIEWSGDNAAQIARKIGAANTTINRFKNGSATTRLGRGTLAKLKDAYPRFPGFVIEADMPEADAHSAYVDINEIGRASCRERGCQYV